jgi:predicted nucleic acid-binding protein
MKLFIDTSSLVKLYHEEAGTDLLIGELGRGYDELCLSELTRLEFRSALWKKVRIGELSQDLAKKAISCFEEDANKFRWVTLDSMRIEKAQDLIMLHGSAGLRTLDSIQLASALALKSDDVFCVTADDLLRIIMQKEGLNIVIA